jgi:hypothetical protein
MVQQRCQLARNIIQSFKMQSTGQLDLVDQFKEYVLTWGTAQQAEVNMLMDQIRGMEAGQYTAITDAVRTELQGVSAWCSNTQDSCSDTQDGLQEPAVYARYDFKIFLERQFATEDPVSGSITWNKLEGHDLPCQHSVPRKPPKTEEIKLQGRDLCGRTATLPELPVESPPDEIPAVPAWQPHSATAA